jgi:hypothetical protein
MANPPIETKNKSSMGTDRGTPNATGRHQKRIGRSGGGPRPSFLDLCKKRLPEEDNQLGSRWEVKIYRLNSLRLAS